MDARRAITIVVGAGLSIFVSGLLGADLVSAGERRTVRPQTTAATASESPVSVDVPVVGARRNRGVPESAPIVDAPAPPSRAPDVAPPPVVIPPAPQPLPAPPPPPPAAVKPAPREKVSGQPQVQAPTRLPVTGVSAASRFAATAGALFSLGGLCIGFGARRKQA